MNAPKTTRSRRAAWVLAVLLATVAGSVVFAVPASAHAGAVGGFQDEPGEQVHVDYSGGKFRLSTHGYAYNGHTVPVQTINMYFYDGSPGERCDTPTPTNFRHATAEYTANQNDPSAAKAIHAHTNAIGWSYDTGWVSPSWGGGIANWRLVRLYVHDKGENGGWVLARQWCVF